MKQSAESPPLVRVDPLWAGVHSLYYERLVHQQRMLADKQRTGAYRAAMARNKSDFEGRVVLDLGAGSGVLSFFAAQAGARRVYAVEATPMASRIRKLVDHATLSDTIRVIQSRVEDLTLPEPVDVIVSEPIGVFLLHERMVEVFLAGRDRFLKPGGKLYPSRAALWLAPFSDSGLYLARTTAAAFWQQTDFRGIDLSVLADEARQELFSETAFGPVDPASLMASPVSLAFDFRSMALGDLARISFPVSFEVAHHGRMHGLAGWFDLLFDGAEETIGLTTAPSAPATHWSQLRFLFQEPIDVAPGQRLTGEMSLEANAQSSYDIHFSGELAGVRAIPSQHYHLHRQFSWAPKGAARS